MKLLLQRRLSYTAEFSSHSCSVSFFFFFFFLKPLHDDFSLKLYFNTSARFITSVPVLQLHSEDLRFLFAKNII